MSYEFICQKNSNVWIKKLEGGIELKSKKNLLICSMSTNEKSQIIIVGKLIHLYAPD